MKRLATRLFSSNSSLVNYMRSTAHLQTVQARRAAVRIAVIDDQAFAPQTNLQSYGYRIDPIGDLKKLSEISDYHIVLCDIMGVGRHFDVSIQGGSIISEIRKNFPEKIVVAYTGGATNARATQIARERAHLILKKDIEIEDWISQLDELGARAIDPYSIWNRIRSRLVDLEVDTRDILLLEDAYVRSIIKRDSTLRLLSQRAVHLKIGPDVRAIIQGLASSAIFTAITGGS